MRDVEITPTTDLVVVDAVPVAVDFAALRARGISEPVRVDWARGVAVFVHGGSATVLPLRHCERLAQIVGTLRALKGAAP